MFFFFCVPYRITNYKDCLKCIEFDINPDVKLWENVCNIDNGYNYGRSVAKILTDIYVGRSDLIYI